MLSTLRAAQLCRDADTYLSTVHFDMMKYYLDRYSTFKRENITDCTKNKSYHRISSDMFIQQLNNVMYFHDLNHNMIHSARIHDGFNKIHVLSESEILFYNTEMHNDREHICNSCMIYRFVITDNRMEYGEAPIEFNFSERPIFGEKSFPVFYFNSISENARPLCLSVNQYSAACHEFEHGRYIVTSDGESVFIHIVKNNTIRCISNWIMQHGAASGDDRYTLHNFHQFGNYVLIEYKSGAKQYGTLVQLDSADYINVHINVNILHITDDGVVYYSGL